MSFITSLHTHVRSQFDAMMFPEDLVKRITEMGGQGIAITDHGVLSSIEDYRPYFADAGLKLIPGCELYIDGGIRGRMHLVVLAMDDEGYHGICKIVTKSNETLQKGYPVITQEKLFEMMNLYRGHIIALSACMQGVLAATILKNSTVQKKIDKVQSELEHSGDPIKDEEDGLNAIKDAETVVKSLIAKRDSTKMCAEQKFVAREKKVAKLESCNSPDAVTARKELTEDQSRAEKAKEELPTICSKLDAAKKTLTEHKKLQEDLTAAADKYRQLLDQLNRLRDELQSESDLYKSAKEDAEKYLSVFGPGCFYAELQYHGIEEEAKCFPVIAKLAKEIGIPVVATNDAHMITNSDDERLRRQILRSMRFGKSFEEESVGDDQLYIKSNEELTKSLLKILPTDIVEESIDNIEVIFNRCDVKFETGKHYPKYKEE